MWPPLLLAEQNGYRHSGQPPAAPGFKTACFASSSFAPVRSHLSLLHRSLLHRSPLAHRFLARKRSQFGGLVGADFVALLEEDHGEVLREGDYGPLSIA